MGCFSAFFKLIIACFRFYVKMTIWKGKVFAFFSGDSRKKKEGKPEIRKGDSIKNFKKKIFDATEGKYVDFEEEKK